MGSRLIIFDESNGESHKGKLIHQFANRIGVECIDNLEELKKRLEFE